ncbi:TetR/AcrR family transcriptional regulator [Treponema sp. SP13]|uniref:TetR/AcrR family transcriptional regulator n=1 Tax=Treponema sp. SP13 TaxID=2789742 RepID=UPI003D91C922
MRNANPEIVPAIKTKTLELLMHKNPDEIAMRDIASNCGITAANIYHYYKDKDELFQAISLDCLNELNARIADGAKGSRPGKKRLYGAIDAFRTWCFENPRRALLVMQGIESASDADDKIIERYYVCNRTGTALLKECVQSGIARSANPALDVGVLVSGLWGCIESVILKKMR